MSHCQGWTALHTSSINDYVNVVKLLIAAKANLNAVDKVIALLVCMIMMCERGFDDHRYIL